MQDGCVAYNGGGDPAYRKKIEAAYLLFAPTAVSAAVPADIARRGRSRGGRWGHFEGRPLTKWQDDGRLMTLMEDFAYVDRGAQCWRAASGITIDGASIPQALWAIVGGPYEGRYRNASVVHDAQCLAPHGSRWEDVHRMFYAACRAGGVRPLKALLMFTAVWLGGPRWTWPTGKPIFVAPLSRNDVLRCIAWIRAHPESALADVEELTRHRLRRSVSDAQVVSEKGRVERWRHARQPARSGRPRDKVLD